jgi:hypothetical protein
MLATGLKVCGFVPGQGNGFLRAIKIRSTPSFKWGVKPQVPCRKILRHIKNSCSPTEMDRLSSIFLLPSPTRSRDVSGGGQSALVDKLGVSPSWYHLPRYTSLSPGDRTIWQRPQFWDVSLNHNNQFTIYPSVPSLHLQDYTPGLHEL